MKIQNPLSNISVALVQRSGRAVRLGAVIVGSVLTASCTSPPQVAPAAAPVARWAPASFAELPGWRDDDWRGVAVALTENCKGMAGKPPWPELCRAFPASGSVAAQRAFVESAFVPYRIERTDAEDSGLITGYYEPVLRGSRTRSERYHVPLYQRPDDLLVVDLSDLYPELKGKRVRGRLVDTPSGRRVVPYFDRAQIVSGEAARATAPAAPLKPWVWVDDAIDAFFLQIQGSGLIDLPDGSRMRVGYADQNGRPFRGIGRLLVERGELTLEQASMQGIRAWLAAHPDRASALLDENPSYVFFREIDAQSAGPLGSLGVPLTATRSLAVDTRFVALGSAVWLVTTRPDDGAPLRRLMFAQDTGGAIRGVVRADFYWGSGREAGELAGRMRQPAQMWVLWPRGSAPPGS